MTATVGEQDLSTAIIASIKDGVFPDSEQVLTAELPASALPSILHEVSKARQQFENEICQISRKTATDVDTWIAQAKQLHDDIAESRAIARAVVKEHEAGKALAVTAQDARAKFILLEEEIKFNTHITQAFEDLKLFDNELHSIQSNLSSGDPLGAAAQWTAVQIRLDTLRDHNGKKIMLEHAREVHKATLTQIELLLDKMITFEKDEHRNWVRILQNLEGSSQTTIENVIEAFEQLGSLDEVTKTISKNIERLVLQPVTCQGPDRHAISISVSSHQIDLSEKADTKDVGNVLQNIRSVLEYLHFNLPKSIEDSIARNIVPDLVSELITTWLTPSVPLELSDMAKFETLQADASQLAQSLSSYGWPGSQAVMDWVNRSPYTWLTKRRMASLDGVRKALALRRGPSRQVERIERQVVSQQDAAFAVKREADEWDSGWNNEREAVPNPTQALPEDDDVSAWDFENDDSDKDGSSDQMKSVNDEQDDDTADAWGWDEDGGSKNRDEAPVKHEDVLDQTASNGNNGNAVSEREVTLKEVYTITDVPDFVLEIIGKDMHEALDVLDPQYAALQGVSPSSGLLALPTFVLAIFRATAPSYYMSTLINGNMHLYNDCMYIAEKLRSVSQAQEHKKILDDCDSLEKFAKSAYAREMDVQRTILADLLDGAQGFTNCTQFPFSKQCDDAVLSVVDRLREVYHGWIAILSHSALLQSVGSLLSMVVDKVVQDIEDMEDITEPESQRLASFCTRFSSLSNLFIAEQPANDETEPVPLTAVYVSNWLRFQYMANILESSLVDIKYLWTEGELSLEFTAVEVIDMIRALFSESPNRRSAIADIRRSRSRASR